MSVGGVANQVDSARGVEVPQVDQLPASIAVPAVDLVPPSTNADISPVNPFGPQPDGKHDLDIPIIGIEINAPTHEAIGINAGPSLPPSPSPTTACGAPTEHIQVLHPIPSQGDDVAALTNPSLAQFLPMGQAAGLAALSIREDLDTMEVDP
ncbi:hypothetical protein PAXINDRAFT_21534 [Paxillus involutus ATCC 200175]|uniref:Uncharacterized protein n=1 Tax=Paxillus involutus ATCC 200175 TaxID=664439 RepID=A0A0C9SLX5_PAXIN|nr:hypothetical protein PAXINDRAFT_21534 [Paxillus involutus ATCC 200175]